MSQFSFGVIGAFILVSLTYGTSIVYARALRMTHFTSMLLFAIFLIVPIIFVLSIIVSRTGTISPILYTLAQSIAGIGLYITIGAIILAIALCVSYIAAIELPTLFVWIVLAFSLLAASIGFFQAEHIVVKRYTVPLLDAPTSWNGKTAILISDTHFGLTRYVNFSQKIISTINALKPDFILHAGDFYDGPSIDTAPISTQWKTIADTTPIFYAPGNHEMYGNYTEFLKSIQSAGITILDNKKIMYDGVQIAGITYHEGIQNPAATEAIASLALDPNVPAILINHPPTALAAAQGANIDLQVSGHTHNGQFWPMTYLVRKIYGPYYYGFKQYKNMRVITSSGVGTFGPAMRLLNSPEIVLITFSTK